MKFKLIVLAVALALFSTQCFAEDCNLGDYNGDGCITGSDVPGFIMAMNSIVDDPYLICIFDFNGDGAVNGSDVPGFIGLFGTCPYVD